MAVFHPHNMKCVCGNTLLVQLADSINVKRFPEFRNKVLMGELHRVTCSLCSRQMTVEKPFYYTDLNRNVFFKVFPRGERYRWKKASNELETAVALVPDEVAKKKGRNLRVLFGMDELREKLVAQDAEIDDRIVELLKVLLVYEHPVLLRRARLRLILDKVTEDSFEFAATYEHHQQRFRLELPCWVVNNFVEQTNQLKKWTKKAHPNNNNIFEVDDHWINMWRWSPQPSALERLEEYAERIRNGEQIDSTATNFQQMLSQLPRGSHLPAWARRDLRTLFEFAKTNNLQALEDKLFEIRFGIELEDDWSLNNDPEDIDTLWKLLKDLPDTNVEGNTKIRQILLEEGEGGGWYSPSSNDIGIGSAELSQRERFEDVMRHEVGHAVHEMKSSLVNNWLETQFGWKVFDSSDAEIDQWVGLMGGWDGLTNIQQSQTRQYLRTAIGNGSSWIPGATPNPPSNHPWYRADFAPRLAFENTGAYWFQNFQTWYRRNGQAFFLNYWYKTFIAVDIKTLDLVARMPDNYASMSHFEFFAEMYALYYDLDDPKRSVIPSDIAKWIDDNIGAPEPAAPRPSVPTQKRDWETITRPGQKAKKRK